MGATGTPTMLGTSVAPVRGMTQGSIFMVPITFTMSASYSTGGDTLTLPSSDVEGLNLYAVEILTRFDGTRSYAWDGSTSAPKIKSLTAFATESSSTTDLSANTVKALLIYVSGE